MQNRPSISANDLLKQPSRSKHKQWAVSLNDLFKNHVTGKFKSNTDEKIKPIGLTESTFVFKYLYNIIVLHYENKFTRISLLLVIEAVRADETASKLNLPTELSTFRKDATNIADGSTLITITNIDPNNRYLNDQDIAHEILTNEILLSEAAGAKEILPPETRDISEARFSKEFVLSTTRIGINYIFI